jgi:hypothetical protein
MTYPSKFERRIEAMNAVTDAESLFGYPHGTLSGKSRRREYVNARMVLFFHINQNIGLSTLESGRVLNRNHATCIHAVKTFRDLYEIDREFKKYADTLLAAIGSDIFEQRVDFLESRIQSLRNQILKYEKMMQSVKEITA